MPAEVTAISEVRLALGEGPLWHPLWQELLIVDVDTGDIHRFDADLRGVGRIELRRITSAITWQADGSLLCFHDRGDVSRLAHPAATPEVVLTVHGLMHSRFNDVIADTRGRILCGALATRETPGRLYRIDPAGAVHLVLDDLGEPNGLAFSVDARKLYLADSVSQLIWRMDYDQATGDLGVPELFYRAQGDELPDGLSVDTNDRLLAAVWNGACVLRISPAGDLEQRIELKPRWVTSLTFGGPNYESVYVTSAQPALGIDDDAVRSTFDGAVLRLDLRVRGRPENPSRLAV